MEKKGDNCEILKTEEIGVLKEKLCKLKHSGKHLKESLEAQNNMQKAFSSQHTQQSQSSGYFISMRNRATALHSKLYNVFG
jgi:hypothetical protein